MGINFGGQNYSQSQVNAYFKLMDNNHDGKVTKQEIKDFEATLANSPDKGSKLDQFCLSLINADGKNNATSFDSLMKIDGKDSSKDGMSYDNNNDSSKINDDSISKTDLGTTFTTINNNKTAIPAEFQNKDNLNTVIKAASKGGSKTTVQDLTALRDQLGTMDPNTPLAGLSLGSSDANSPASILSNGGFKTAGDAKKYLDVLLDPNNKTQLDALDKANDSSGKADSTISTDDVNAYANQQSVNTAANQAATSNSATAQTPLQNGAQGVYSKVTTADGMTTTDLYKMNPDGSMTTTTTVTAGGKTSSVTTTTTDKTGHTTGATQTYGDDGKVNGTTAIDKTGDQTTIPTDATATNSTDPKTPGGSYTPATDLKDGDAGVYKKVDAEDGVYNTTLYKKNPDGSITQTQITQNLGDDGKPTGDPTGITTTTTSSDGKTMTGTMTTIQQDGTKKVSDINNANVPAPSIPSDATPTNSGDPTDDSGKPPKLDAGKGDGAGMNGADNFYAVSNANGADDYVTNIVKRERQKAGLSTDAASIQEAIDNVGKQNHIDPNKVGNGQVLDLSTIYFKQAQAQKQ